MSDQAVTDVSSKEELASLESPQDTSPSSETVSICKEQLRVEPTYAVEKYHDKDDAGYVAPWKKRLHSLLPLTSVTAIGAYWLYVAFRVRYTIALQRVRHTVFPVAWIFLTIEVGVARKASHTPRMILHGFLLMRTLYSTITALPILAIILYQDSPPR